MITLRLKENALKTKRKTLTHSKIIIKIYETTGLSKGNRLLQYLNICCK